MQRNLIKNFSFPSNKLLPFPPFFLFTKTIITISKFDHQLLCRSLAVFVRTTLRWRSPKVRSRLSSVATQVPATGPLRKTGSVSLGSPMYAISLCLALILLFLLVCVGLEDLIQSEKRNFYICF